jgi:hypothetical protein
LYRERNTKVNVRKVSFKVLLAARMKTLAFRDIVPCSLVEVYRRFRGSSIIRAMTP